jgi:hypothetical protein
MILCVLTKVFQSYNLQGISYIVLARTQGEVFFFKYRFLEDRGRLILGSLRVNTNKMILRNSKC